jgi:(heptosyl)LPS beta-1,4-glucosyltransferase
LSVRTPSGSEGIKQNKLRLDPVAIAPGSDKIQSAVTAGALHMNISATIITHNEADNIRDACESVSWADEILIVDSESTDDTRQIAVACGARVIINAWPGFARQKQFAADSASYDWIFSLDADERVSPELRASIEKVRTQGDDARADGYRVSRRAYYMKRWIRGGGWYPDYQLRLFNRHRGQWGDRLIHESVVMNAGSRVESLRGDLLHYSMRDPAHHRQMIEERYAPLGAEQMLREGNRTSSLQSAVAGPAAFIRSFVLKGGFRDGQAGWMIAKMAAYHASLKHSILSELQKEGSKRLERKRPRLQ